MGEANIFHILSDIGEKTGISCVLIGGFAVNYYKVTRQTADIDFLITEEDFVKIKHSLTMLGFKHDYAHDVFARFTSSKPHLMDLDYMFVDRDTLDKIIKSGKIITIAGRRFIVPSLRDLIALKLHSLKNNPNLRVVKDFQDILNLIRVNRFGYKTVEFRGLCLKYGTEKIYEDIIRSLK